MGKVMLQRPAAQDMGTAISGGADVHDEATRADESIVGILNG